MATRSPRERAASPAARTSAGSVKTRGAMRDRRGESYRRSAGELIVFGLCSGATMPCPRRTRIAWVGLALVLTGALTAATSNAAPSDEVRLARALFVQAEADEDGERWGEALEKLQAVARVKLTAGVRYHIALCEEHLGHLVRALGDYREAEDQARLENAQDVLRIVGNQVAALEPRVPRLTVRVAPAVSEVALKLDGEPIGNAAIGAPMQVDPGVHYVVATAPDRPPAAAE